MFPKLPTKFIVPFKMGDVCFETPGDYVFEIIGFFRRHKTSKLTLSTKAGTLSCDK